MGNIGHCTSQESPLTLKALSEGCKRCMLGLAISVSFFNIPIQLSIFFFTNPNLNSSVPTAAPKCRVPLVMSSIPLSFDPSFSIATPVPLNTWFACSRRSGLTRRMHFECHTNVGDVPICRSQWRHQHTKLGGIAHSVFSARVTMTVHTCHCKWTTLGCSLLK